MPCKFCLSFLFKFLDFQPVTLSREMPIHDTPLSLGTIGTVLYALEAARRMDDYPLSLGNGYGWIVPVGVRALCCVVLCFDGYLIVRGSVRLLKVDIIHSFVYT